MVIGRVNSKQRLLYLLFSVISYPVSCNVVVDAVFLLDPAVAFPFGFYESILQQISGCTIASPSTLKLDTIVGAEARSLYFPNNTTILRFQLVHITRIHSQLSTAGVSASVPVMVKLRTSLADSVWSRIGVCGIEGIYDPDVDPISSSADNGQWYSNIVLLVILIGWILTLLLCGICWLCVCCSNKTVPSAEVAVPEGPVEAVVPLVGLPLKGVDTPAGNFRRGYSSHSLLNDRVNSGESPYRSNPYAGAEFTATAMQSINERGIPLFLDMRLPSFAPPC